MPPHWASSEEAVMQSAPVSLPSEPINGVTCGIDWARADHAVSVVDRSGRESSALDGRAQRGRPARAGPPTRPGRRGRGHDRTTGRPGRRGVAGRRADGGGDQPEPAEEPARPVRVCSPRPRPRLALRHLALLARPSLTSRPNTEPSKPSNQILHRRLDQGYSRRRRRRAPRLSHRASMPPQRTDLTGAGISVLIDLARQPLPVPRSCTTQRRASRKSARGFRP